MAALARVRAFLSQARLWLGVAVACAALAGLLLGDAMGGTYFRIRSTPLTHSNFTGGSCTANARTRARACAAICG